MACEWPAYWTRASLGEVADVNWGDTSVTKASYVETGFRAYSASGPDGLLSYADFERVGVVLSAIGAECGRTWLAKGKWSCIKNTLRFWATHADVDTEFLYWLTRDPAVWPKRGSAQPFISQGDARTLEVAYPPLIEQRAIAHILGTLDDKIELNRRMSETLEAMARALFKSWFVDFDPVRAKTEGRDPGLPRHIADLFPGSFVDSELGEIPKGWEVRSIGELAEIVGGSTPKTERAEYWEDGTHHWVTPKDLSGLPLPVLLDTERKITDAGLTQISSGLLPKGTVLLSSRAPIGYLAIAEVPVAVNQGFIAMKPRPGTSNLFLLRWASVSHDEIVSHANGSTFLEISKSNFRPIRIVAPTAPIMHVFDRLSRPLYLKVVEHEHESRTLAALRDALLPKLISGEIRLKDAERFITEAR
ncbi:MAG TPA: restriction endonuclease subunit S [bacterium]|nr:restriction endonuclease subunit S [bacterium]